MSLHIINIDFYIIFIWQIEAYLSRWVKRVWIVPMQRKIAWNGAILYIKILVAIYVQHPILATDF